MENSNNIVYNALMRVVDCEIINHKGAGFTVEIAPTITKQIKYVSRNASLFGWNLIWSPCEKNTRGVFVTEGLPKPKYPRCHAPREVETMLPNGIQIIRKPVQTLQDDRVLYSPLSKVDQYAYYTEGQQNYLSVSDEFAAKFFKEKYTDIGYPFRDQLLSKYSDLLRKIVLFMVDQHYSFDFRVSAEYIGDSIFPFRFKDLNMVPLNSTGQLYGMTLALIETLKNHNPKLYENYIYTVNIYGDNTPLKQMLHIRFEKSPETKQPEKLNEW